MGEAPRSTTTQHDAHRPSGQPAGHASHVAPPAMITPDRERAHWRQLRDPPRHGARPAINAIAQQVAAAQAHTLPRVGRGALEIARSYADGDDHAVRPRKTELVPSESLRARAANQ